MPSFWKQQPVAGVVTGLRPGYSPVKHVVPPAAYMDCSVWPSLTSGRLFSSMALLLERVEESLVAEAGFPVLLDPGV